MMSGSSEFAIRYWGVRGTFSRCLLPEDVTEKIVATIALLQRAKSAANLIGESCC